MNRKKLFLIISILLAISAMLATLAYLDQERKRISVEAQRKIQKITESQSAVLVAKKDIAKGATIDPDSAEARIVPSQYVQPGAVTSADRISGMITVAPIAKDEQITMNKLTSGQKAQGYTLAMSTPVGKRAIAIPVDNISSLSGMIKPGDYVDVITTIPVPVQTPDGKQSAQPATIPLFQNVLVLAVGQETSAANRADEGRYKKDEKRDVAPLITLALSPQEANLLAFVQEQTKVRLILRSPADSQVQPMQPVSWDALLQYLMPPQTENKAQEQAVKKEEQPQKPATYIEIYRGLKKESIPLSEPGEKGAK